MELPGGPAKMSEEHVGDPVSDSLLSALECPVCMEYMLPPIALCESGHDLCSQCRPRLPCCPTCRKPFLRARNVALETIVSGLRYPCRNRLQGCALTLPAGEVLAHQAACPHRPRDCPLGCPWKGALGSLPEHLARQHPRQVVCAAEATLLLDELTVTASYSHAILAHGEVFLHRCRLHKDRFSAAAALLGPAERAREFCHELRLVADDGARCVAARERTVASPDGGDPQALWLSSSCATLHYDVVRRFMYGNSLPVRVKVCPLGEPDSPSLPPLSLW